MGKVLFFSLTSALNPTLLAAVTVLLVLPRPGRLLLGYLLGAAMTSITLGLVIVFSLQDSSVVSTAKHTLSPGADFALALIFLVVAYLLESGRDEPIRERRREKKAAKQKGPPRWQQWLGRGSPRVTFAVGAILTLPGASYLAGLGAIAEQDSGDVGTVLLVLFFNMIMLLLVELPVLGFALAPGRTVKAVDGFKSWLGRSGRSTAVKGMAAVGLLLIVRALITVLS